MSEIDNEMWKEIYDKAWQKYEDMKSEYIKVEQENQRLRDELHSKVEFIQEQRDIIESYKKEIEMYKKCQGKRSCKREQDILETLVQIENIAESYMVKGLEPQSVEHQMKIRGKEELSKVILELINKIKER